jgi:hypothetical protein
MAKRKVRLTVQVSGTRDGLYWPPVGTVVDLDDDEAEGLMTAGIAEAVTEKAKTAKTAKKRPSAR